MEERIFTLEEARYLLPRLRSIMEDAGQEWRRMKLLNPEIQKLRDKASMDAFSPYGVPYVHSLSHLVYLLQQIKDMGVVVKDVDQGLCDFPYMRATLDHLRFEVIKFEQHRSDNRESKVYVSKNLGVDVLKQHQTSRSVVEAA